ncbi:MAG: hypothetical protein ACREQ5_03770 [Candidatus Dormibacteria bacterium]
MTEAKTAETVMTEIAAERKRQIDVKGWTPEHDENEHEKGQLAMAAACYAAPHRVYKKEDYADGVHFVDPWPWSTQWDKRPYEGNAVRGNGSKGEKLRRRLLVKAAVLIVAEIERMDRR